MKKRKLAMLLGRVPAFPRPKIRLEQYKTDPEVAAEAVLALASVHPDASIVADLGCGTGMLSYALLHVLSPSLVACIDVDREALMAGRDFMRSEKFDIRIEFVEADALHPPLRRVEAIVMNPPFGIRSRRGVDLDFLYVALRLAETVVSIHAWSDGLLGAVERRTGCRPLRVLRGRLIIPAFLEEHRRRAHRVEVAILVFRGCSFEERG